MARTTPRKHEGPDPRAAADAADTFLRSVAQREYEQRRAEHLAELAAASEHFAALLHNPEHNTTLGLPADLPDFTIGVLRETMARDVIGPKEPQIDKVYGRWVPRAMSMRLSR